MSIALIPAYVEPIYRFLTGKGELASHAEAFNLYEYLVHHDPSDSAMTVCGVTFTRIDLISWASYNLQTESSGKSPSVEFIKNAWPGCDTVSANKLLDLIRGVPTIPSDLPTTYAAYVDRAFSGPQDWATGTCAK